MASGDTLAKFLPQHGEPPASNPATPDTRNQHPVLDFDATTNESIVFSDVMVRHYDGGGATVYIHYSMSTATANTIDWDVAWERIGDQQLDIDGDSFAAVNSVDNTTVPGTYGPDMDSVAVGEGYRLKITRDAVNDDAAGDGEVRLVEIKET